MSFILGDFKIHAEVLDELSMEGSQMFFLIPSLNCSMGLRIWVFICTTGRARIPRPEYSEHISNCFTFLSALEHEGS